MSSNATCHMKESAQSPPPLFQNGKIDIQAHHIGWAVTGLFTLAATIVSGWLINKHLQWYTNKREQRYIVRILFMVPIYSIVSFGSYLFWNQSTPLLLVRDCYESTVLTSFFYLLLMYLSPNSVEQKDIFRKVGLSKENDREAFRRGEPVKKWMFPLGIVKSKPKDGLYFLQIMKWGVLQYCVIRPTTTLAAIILDYVGLYCESSWSPGWGYVYITVIVSISVSIAMYCLIQLYVPISSYLTRHRPLLKLFSIKAVVFLTFWQATFLSLLATFGLVKDTQYMTAEDINIGIGAIMETVEMTIFAFVHIKAFSYKPYVQNNEEVSKGYALELQRTPRLRSLAHALDYRETFRELWYGCVYILNRWRGRETDRKARRLAVREQVFGERQLGKSRATEHAPVHGEERPPEEKRELSPELQDLKIAVDVRQEVHVDDELQWLGAGDDYIYGLDFPRRERSAGLGEQIEQELERRGLPQILREKSRARTKRQRAHNGSGHPPEDSGEAGHQKQRSWWKGVYDRISGADRDVQVNNILQDGTSTETSMKPSRNISLKSKLTTARGIAEADMYTPIPGVDSYDDRLPSPQDAKQGGRSRPHWSPIDTSFIPPVSTRQGRLVAAGARMPSEKGSAGRVTNDEIQSSPSPDQVLSRLFASPPPRPPKSDAGTSTSGSIALSTNPSSQAHSQSDRHFVRLAPPALVVPKSGSAARTLVIVYDGDSDTETWRRREKSSTAVVESTLGAHSGYEHNLHDPSGLNLPPDTSSFAGPVEPSSNRSKRESYGQEVATMIPKGTVPRIILPVPLSPSPATTAGLNTHQATTEVGLNVNSPPEIRISLAQPVMRKIVPQYAEVPSRIVHLQSEVQHYVNTPVLQDADARIRRYPFIDSADQMPNSTSNESAGTKETVSQFSEDFHHNSHAKVDISNFSSPMPCSSVNGDPIPGLTSQAGTTRDKSLQRRGARAVRCSTALPSSSPTINNAGVGVPSAARHSLPMPKPMKGTQRPKHSGYRSSPRYNFRRHEVAGHPIAEESSGTSSSRSSRKLPVPPDARSIIRAESVRNYDE